MTKSKGQIIIKIIKTILFFTFLYSLIRLIPNIVKSGFIGITFLVLSIIYILNEAFIYLIKEPKISNNLIQSIMNILLYVYIILLAYRYIASLTDPTYIIEESYFIINYIIASIGMIGTIFNTMTILNEK